MACRDCGKFFCEWPIPAYVTRRCPECTAYAINRFSHVNRNSQTEEPDQILPAEARKTGANETESP